MTRRPRLSILLLLFCFPAAAFAQATTAPASNVASARQSILLTSDSDTVFDVNVKATAIQSNAEFTLSADPASAATDRTFTLKNPVWIGFYSTLVVQSTNNFSVKMPIVSSNQPGGKIKPVGARVQIGTLSGDISLDGETAGHSLGTYSGRALQKLGPGSWTVTGDNSKCSWTTAIEAGELILAPGASLGNSSIWVRGTFSPRAGTSVDGLLNMANQSTLNLADGTVGPFTVNGRFSGPNGGSVTLKFDIDSTSVDQLIIQDVADTNDIKDYVVLNRISKKLTPGRYTLAVLRAPGRTLMENHMAFDFTGDPADHSHMVMTQVDPDYTFTLAPVVDAQGHWTAETLTVTQTINASTRPAR